MLFLHSSVAAAQWLFARRFFGRACHHCHHPCLSHLGVRRHRQHRDYRSYHKGSHLDGSLTARSAWEANIRIVANPPPCFSEPATRFETHLRVQGAHPLEISREGFMLLSDTLKPSVCVPRMHPAATTA